MSCQLESFSHMRKCDSISMLLQWPLVRQTLVTFPFNFLKFQSEMSAAENFPSSQLEARRIADVFLVRVSLYYSNCIVVSNLGKTYCLLQLRTSLLFVRRETASPHITVIPYEVIFILTCCSAIQVQIKRKCRAVIKADSDSGSFMHNSNTLKRFSPHSMGSCCEKMKGKKTQIIIVGKTAEEECLDNGVIHVI